ncbi:MAG: hypothetical protein ACKVRN_17175 [Pyrinomonadaceae bacterium]
MVKHIFLFFFITCASGFSLAQTQGGVSDHSLTKKEKSAVNKRIALISKQYRKKQWRELYASFLREPVEGRTQDEFVKEMKENDLNPNFTRKFVDFHPKSYIVIKHTDKHEVVAVFGCILVTEERKKLSYWGAVNVGRRDKKSWLLLDLPGTNPGIVNGGPKPCPS